MYIFRNNTLGPMWCVLYTIYPVELGLHWKVCIFSCPKTNNLHRLVEIACVCMLLKVSNKIYDAIHIISQNTWDSFYITQSNLIFICLCNNIGKYIKSNIASQFNSKEFRKGKPKRTVFKSVTNMFNFGNKENS